MCVSFTLTWTLSLIEANLDGLAATASATAACDDNDATDDSTRNARNDTTVPTDTTDTYIVT